MLKLDECDMCNLAAGELCDMCADWVARHAPNMKPETEWSSDASMLVGRIRESLQARLEGRNEGGDIEVMRLVDEIVEKEGSSCCSNCNPGWQYERSVEGLGGL
jgi:hypothetical protein